MATVARTLDRRGDRFVRMVAAYTGILGLGLTVLIVFRSAGIGVFLAFVLPLFFAAWIAIRFRGRPILVLAAILVGVPGVLSLIGGVGLFILPASFLFLVAAFRSRPCRRLPASPFNPRLVAPSHPLPRPDREDRG